MAKKYIDAEEANKAIKLLRQEFEIDDTDEAYNDALIDCEYYIANIPAADVAEVRHGHWIRHKEYNDDYDQYDEWCNCSECCFQATAVNEMPYCPHCGAKMDKSEDEEL